MELQSHILQRNSLDDSLCMPYEITFETVNCDFFRVPLSCGCITSGRLGSIIILAFVGAGLVRLGGCVAFLKLSVFLRQWWIATC